MKIFKSQEVREIDAYTIRNEPISSIDLMERASERLAGWYVRHFRTDRPVVLFAGPGNNGGDALAMARMLAERQFRIRCVVLRFGNQSEDCKVNEERLKMNTGVELMELKVEDILPELNPGDVVVDGIFGSGLSRSAAGFPAKVIRHINQHDGPVISIDIPSGLFGEDNSGNDQASIVRADFTITFQFPFLSFFFDCNAEYVGEWRVHSIKLHPEIIQELETPYRTIEEGEIIEILPQRRRFAHKGTFGHGLLISGSYGMMGAALLAGESCLRSGTGLVTLHVPGTGYTIVQTRFPEAIVSLDNSDVRFTRHPELGAYTAVGIGPGLGCDPESGEGLKRLLENIKVPLVIDADGLNLLSGHPEWYELLPAGTILTPHPKEFDRLAGKSSDSFQRHLKQLEFAGKYGVYVILKGAYTGIATPQGDYWFNTSGNPGMATGGSGDVLTGLITGLLAQGMDPLSASKAGVCLHGLAGDLAARETGEEAMIAGDVISKLGPAFKKVHSV